MAQVIGFIGLRVMEGAVARNLLDAGAPLIGRNQTTLQEDLTGVSE